MRRACSAAVSNTSHIDRILTDATKLRASDLHLRVGAKPLARVDGKLTPIDAYPQLSSEQVRALCGSLLDENRKAKFARDLQLDFPYHVPGVGRFRVAMFRQQGEVGVVFRRIPEEVPTLADINAPRALIKLARRQRGLVLVTGPTGSGKSTTLAAMIDLINGERNEHILTLEDPIEFVHPLKNCVVNQREVGRDVPDFAVALKGALRQDPDVILVGEMRDLETISTAITAAETGHLVFATLHTQSAADTISRIINVFPEGEQQQIRTQLAESLEGIVAQTLLPRADGRGRVAAFEVLIATNPVRGAIRENKIPSIRTTLQTSARVGMQSMDKALAHLAAQQLVDHEIARQKAHDRGEFDRLYQAAVTGKNLDMPPTVTEHDLIQDMNAVGAHTPTPDEEIEDLAAALPMGAPEEKSAPTGVAGEVAMPPGGDGKPKRRFLRGR
jgi:twitching motility protein PilT